MQPTTGSPLPSIAPAPIALPIDDPRDFLIGYWSAEEGAYIEAYTYDAELDEYVLNFTLSPYEVKTRYAFYPDGQFLRATPQSEGDYPIYEYGTWRLLESNEIVELTVLQCYTSNEDNMYMRQNPEKAEKISVSIGDEYTYYADAANSRRHQAVIAIHDKEFVRSNGTWDLMNDFAYALTGEMKQQNSWDSDADMSCYNGKTGCLKVYFEGTLLSKIEDEIPRYGHNTYSYDFCIQLSRGTYGFLAQCNIYPTTENMNPSAISFSCEFPIEINENRSICFTGTTFFHEGF